MRKTLNSLYETTEYYDIDVISVDTDEVESMSITSENSGRCYIGINPFMLTTESEEVVHLAHELGHCVTGAFYNRYSKLDIREKHERRADKWAIKKLIPLDELKAAYARGIVNNEDIADYFCVTEEFLQKALKYYIENN